MTRRKRQQDGFYLPHNRGPRLMDVAALVGWAIVFFVVCLALATAWLMLVDIIAALAPLMKGDH